MSDFTMPTLGADMEEGTLLEWLVRPGDVVEKGEMVAVVDTAKAAVEVESFQSGTVEELLVGPGTTVPVGTPLARIADTEPGRPAGDGGTPPPSPAHPAAPEPAEAPEPAAAPGPVGAPPSGRRPRATPPVRRLATELGVDLSTVNGSGAHGHVTRADVLRAVEPVPRAAPRTESDRRPVTPYARRLAAELGVDLADVTVEPGRPVRAADVRRLAAPTTAAGRPRKGDTSPMRTAIAAAMARSKREIPHYYLSTTIDLAAALDWMHARNIELPVSRRLVPAALLLKATALAAVDVPEVNGFWEDGAFRPGTGVHLGVAVSLRGGGLVAPALHDAAEQSLEDLMAGLRDLVTRARGGRLRRQELTEPTLTVTNLGDQGVESVHGIIAPPQVALVGFGRVVRQPCAVGDLIGIRPVVTATLAGDHRATDGFTGGRLLDAIHHHLQRPEEL
jgi:pyruvate dehydrogenase E2 component (dihydrolipoamide acetyltransferase)